MPKKLLILLIVCVAIFLLLSTWVIYRGIRLSQNAFLTGAPPADIQKTILPNNLDLTQMRPPAPRAHDPIRFGTATSFASVIAFGDYECEACRQLEPVLKQVIPTFKGKVRLIWRDFPVTRENPDAIEAAIFARCAGLQGKFWETHDALFGAKRINESTYLSIATILKLNRSELNACRKDPGMQQAIETDIATARGDGIHSAPFLFIGTKAVSGEITAETLRKEIELFLGS